MQPTNIFQNCQYVTGSTAYEPIVLKDESTFEKLFDEEHQEIENNSTDYPVSSSFENYNASGAASSSNECSISINQFETLSNFNIEDNFNIDQVITNETNLSPAALAPLEDERETKVQNIKPVVSREGLRQAGKKSSAQSGGVRRRKKTANQVEYLTTLYKRLGGKWDGKVRKEAMAATGLSRIQIYKWFFDRQL